MANWDVNNFHTPETINNNKKYEVGDNLSLDAINAAIENSFFRQANEGTAVTSGGQFQSTWDATFADAERQKTKNLFNKSGNLTYGSYVSSYYVRYDGSIDSIVAYGRFSSNGNSGQLLNVKPNTTYTVSGILTNATGTPYGSGSSARNAVVVIHGLTSNRYKYLVYSDSQVSFSFQFTTNSNPNDVWIEFNADNDSGEATYAYFKNIQVEEGSTATSYQEYYGVIVHQKEMEGYAQPLAIDDTAVSITNSTLTTGKDFFDYFRNNYPRVFKCSRNFELSINFQTLVGIPASFGNYGTYWIIPEVFTSTTSKQGNVFKIVLTDTYAKHFAIGYMYNVNYNNTETIMFSGWTSLDGSQKYPVV